jgi:magnesium transporter
MGEVAFERAGGAETAGGAAVVDVPRAGGDELAGDTRSRLVGEQYAYAGDLVVLDGGRLIGVVPVERLLAAPAEAPVATLVDGGAPVAADADLEAAARATAHRGGRSVAVVDTDGAFLGLVPPETLVRRLELDHEVDLARLGGVLTGTRAARRASEESVPRRLWHRLPWLAIGLAGAMLSALLVGGFEDELRDEVLLAFFVPAVVYMADAVGTQTETLVIRGMALGVGIRSIVARELATGLVIGVLLGSAFFVFVLAAWNDERVALAVAISLAISCSVATIVAMALPYGLARLGRDPAFGSGPLATVIQDLLSIAAYFAVALLIVF